MHDKSSSFPIKFDFFLLHLRYVIFGNLRVPIYLFCSDKLSDNSENVERERERHQVLAATTRQDGDEAGERQTAL